MPAESAPSRRSFLGTAAGALAVPLAAPSVQARGRSEALSIGVIGCGARGTALALELVKLGHTVTALCDVAGFRLAAITEALAAAAPDADEPDAFTDYRKLLDVKTVDAIVIATPDHHHKEQLVAAVLAEKDVYVEAPVTRSLDEGAEITDAVQKSTRVVQVGNQRRSGPHWEEAVRAVRHRAFGKLVRAKAWDAHNWQAQDPAGPPVGFKADPKKLDWEAFLGTAPKRPFDPFRYWAWRWHWDYAAGLLSDPAVHHLDLFAWAGAVDAPKSAVTNGGRYFFDKWETPDVIHGVWDFGKFVAHHAADAVTGADGVGISFHGTMQTLVCDPGREIRLYDTAAAIPPGMKPVRVWRVEPETPAHLKNWVECVKSRDEPAAPVGQAVRTAVAAHLATHSYRTGKKQFWDADRNEIIGGG